MKTLDDFREERNDSRSSEVLSLLPQHLYLYIQHSVMSCAIFHRLANTRRIRCLNEGVRHVLTAKSVFNPRMHALGIATLSGRHQYLDSRKRFNVILHLDAARLLTSSRAPFAF